MPANARKHDRRAESPDHEDPIQHLRTTDAILRSAPVCAGSLIHRKWAFEQRAGGHNPRIEPLHCASYKVALLEPVLLAEFKNERSSLRPSSRAWRGSDPPKLLLVLFPPSTVCNDSPTCNYGSSPSLSAQTYEHRAFFPTGKRVTVLCSNFCRSLVGESGSFSAVSNFPSSAEVQIGMRG